MPRDAPPSVPAVAVSVVVGEGHACLGVDIQVALAAPFGECGWIDYGTNHDLAAGADAAFQTVGLILPFLEAGGQPIGIRHDLQDSRIVLLQIPRDTDDLDLPEGVRNARI